MAMQLVKSSDLLKSTTDKLIDSSAPSSLPQPGTLFIPYRGEIVDAKPSVDIMHQGEPINVSGSYTSDYKHKTTSIDLRTHDLSGKKRIQSSEYYFMGSMSQELINKYLDRSLFMQSYSHAESWFDPPTDSTLNPEKKKGMDMMRDVRPKVVGLISFWGGEDDMRIHLACEQLTKDIDAIHAFDPDVICQAGIMEIANFGDTTIPDFVLSEFGYLKTYYNTSTGTYTTVNVHTNADGVVTNKFDARKMSYDEPYLSEVPADISKSPAEVLAERRLMPDFTKVETQMWFYYMATRYIDCGCEMLQLGDSFLMVFKDKEYGHQSLWSLMQRIRKYGSTRNRGVVLLEGRYRVGGFSPYYFDPETSPIKRARDKGHERQLLFDILSSGVPLFQLSGKAPWPAYPPCTSSYAPVELRKVDLIGNSPGGLHPMGWYCKHTPYRLQLDQGSSEVIHGCGVGVVGSQGTYGWDNTGWFAAQAVDYRNKIIKYIHYQVKCFDRKAHYVMSGRHVYSTKVFPGEPWQPPLRYNAYTGAASQQDTIKCVWNNAYATPPDWVHHNFCEEEIFNPGPDNTSRCLIFVGNDKIFYIGNDGYIHGCVLYNGVWLGVSPSYAADIYYGQRVSDQVKVKSDLVASPDGKQLLYLGEDGQFHGFDIVDIWHYYYTGVFMKTKLGKWRKVVENTLIYPGNDRIYYVEVMSDGSQRMHGFQKSSGAWQAVSPTYSAEIVFHQHVAGQFEVAGGLAYDYSVIPNRIYYRGKNGYLAYYEVVNLIDYKYVPCPGNLKLSAQGLKIVGKLALAGNRIYYVALYGNDTSSIDSYRIHCLIDMGGGFWDTVSPSYSAQEYYGRKIKNQPRSDANGEIAVSSDGMLIAYFGRIPGSYVFVFRNIDNERYKFEGTSPAGFKSGNNSLQFRGHDIFYANQVVEQFIHKLKFEENYCQNPALHALPGT